MFVSFFPTYLTDDENIPMSSHSWLWKKKRNSIFPTVESKSESKTGIINPFFVSRIIVRKLSNFKIAESDCQFAPQCLMCLFQKQILTLGRNV